LKRYNHSNEKQPVKEINPHAVGFPVRQIQNAFLQSWRICLHNSKFDKLNFCIMSRGLCFHVSPTKKTTDEKLPAASIMARYFVLFAVGKKNTRKKTNVENSGNDKVLLP